MTGISSDALRDCLAAVEPLELKGMVLLREHRSSGLFLANLPRQQVQEAVEEIIAYTTRCAETARRMSNLRPVPLMNDVTVYGL